MAKRPSKTRVERPSPDEMRTAARLLKWVSGLDVQPVTVLAVKRTAEWLAQTAEDDNG